uniref:Uncharacterized protein n=1 Tax=Anguilla anguilla TaxID=7936 RepID=A0A0E9VJU0_ANGAN
MTVVSSEDGGTLSWLRRSTFCEAEQAGERGRRNGRPNSFSHLELTRRIAKSP